MYRIANISPVEMIFAVAFTVLQSLAKNWSRMLPSVTMSMITTVIVTSFLCDVRSALIDELDENFNAALRDGPPRNENELRFMSSLVESETRRLLRMDILGGFELSEN